MTFGHRRSENLYDNASINSPRPFLVVFGGRWKTSHIEQFPIARRLERAPIACKATCRQQRAALAIRFGIRARLDIGNRAIAMDGADSVQIPTAFGGSVSLGTKTPNSSGPISHKCSSSPSASFAARGSLRVDPIPKKLRLPGRRSGQA